MDTKIIRFFALENSIINSKWEISHCFIAYLLTKNSLSGEGISWQRGNFPYKSIVHKNLNEYEGDIGVGWCSSQLKVNAACIRLGAVPAS